ncbi:MAG: hypothetical protein Salg2KO_20860 [Salibacteraceae bacterium]
METLVQIDQALSLTINHFHAPWADQLMLLISGRLTWIPLYALLAYLLFKQHSIKVFGVLLVLIALNVVLTDQISVAMKYGFERLRPCHAEHLVDLLHLPGGCGGQFGFVSSHAANTAGLAVLLGLLIRKNWVTYLLIAFALLNSYSRVYLGKHYLGDVVGGMVLGVVVGLVVYQLSLYLLKRLE